MDHVSRDAIRTRGHHALSVRWRAVFGRAARKIPLDAGFSCPNRDGTLSKGGCIFCNARGAGTGLARLPLAEQWARWREARQARWGDVALVGYLQAFSNTHGPARRLARVLDELSHIPDLEGLCLGTRPDCLDHEKLALLAAFPAKELWLELGLQSCNPATLARVNRGHGPESFAEAVRAARDHGLKVCAHLMAGLPGEDERHWDATVDFVASLPVAGVKFHNLHVARGSLLETHWRIGGYEPIALERYAAWLARALARLSPEVVVHRLAADPAHGELLAPEWAGDKRRVHEAIRRAAAASGLRQGDLWPPAQG
ncbi:Ribosomal protein S12 methylthiotransferase RimO [Fundidesulfovibrio magnetotacticus]|uniref:Ribosomal protein S12 methylthiotransferase RimO n=1 Tax=Fundidesulfovibrio magnetotacticus TaxID=2730080 RepID=A0A6V8LRY8_9BACT|nr:TIGR01212 family radical SAM protein [Fundidesulfovibrio magnetotacticus]GFK95232.1 Ribosomal protein S12 methylthiotransferase RimO [Fundidesulfovibrio magnetotacticus]